MGQFLSCYHRIRKHRSLTMKVMGLYVLTLAVCLVSASAQPLFIPAGVTAAFPLLADSRSPPPLAPHFSQSPPAPSSRERWPLPESCCCSRRILMKETRTRKPTKED